MLVSRFQQLEDERAIDPGRELVRQGAREQFGPILAATLATAAFLLPFVVMGSPIGLEIVHPLATVLLGGLVTATLVSLFAVPALYAGFAARTERDPADSLLYRWAEAAPAPEAGGGRVVPGADAGTPGHSSEQLLAGDAAPKQQSPAEGS